MKLDIGKIYDQSGDKYAWSCLMTNCYFDPWEEIKQVQASKSNTTTRTTQK